MSDETTGTGDQQSIEDAGPLPESGESPMDQVADSTKNMDVVMEIPVRLSMEVGNTNISIRKLLELKRGSVVELNRLAGEPLDVLVNGTMVAHGEVVVVNERFGIRLTDVISPEQRIEMLH